MALTDYNSLVTEVGTWLGRSDLSSEVDTAIALVEADCNRELRTRNMLATTQLATVAGSSSLTVPTDFLEAEHLENTSEPRLIEFMTRDQVLSQFSAQQTGYPQGYTGGAGSTFGIAPKADAVYTLNLRYYQKISNLNAANPTNWFYALHPNVYFFGCQHYLTVFTDDASTNSKYESLYEKAKADVAKFDRRSRLTGPGMTARTRGCTP